MIRTIAALGVLLAPLPASASDAVVTLSAEAKATPPGAGEATVVVLVAGYGDTPKGAEMVWKRYDRVTGRTPMFRAKGDTAANTVRLYFKPAGGPHGADRYTVFTGIVPAGDYALVADLRGLKITQFCEGTVVMHVDAGSVAYLGSFRVYSGVEVEGSSAHRALGWEGDLAKAKVALVDRPKLANSLVAAPVENGAKFDCMGGGFVGRRTAYQVPGAPDIAVPAGSPAAVKP